jgi:ElaB/YqjD/DUF883 family membrane-anchored ribosome-binding protein
MAHQSTTIPIRSTRNEPISWPNSEEIMPRALPARKPATAKGIYESSLAAAERSLRAARRKTSDAAASLNVSIRRFADERPLQLVGIVAGVALLAGVALRVWRSQNA